MLKNSIDSENYENRTLAEFPSFNNITEFPSQFDSWLNDRLPFKNQMTAANSALDIKLFRRSSSGRVVYGSEGWLYYSDVTDGNCMATYKGIDLYTNDELALIARHLCDAQDILNNMGSEFILFIAPDKQQLYPEYIPDYITRVNTQTRTAQLVEYLRANTNIIVLYPLEELQKAKENYAVFYQLDTHWNDYGAYTGAKALLGALGCEDLLCTDYKIEPQTPTTFGDLANVGMTGELYYEHNNVILSGNFGTYTTNELDYNHLSSYSSNKSDCADITVMIERDSFSDSMLQFICPVFKNTVLYHRNNFDSSSVYKTMPDVFVYETVERYLDQIMNFTLSVPEE